MPGQRPSPFAWLAAAAVLLLSINLRPGATSIGPVLAEVQRALGLSHTWSGVLTALPGLCFAVFGAVAVSLASRTGVNAGIVLGVAAIVLGLGLRVLVPDAGAFLACTVVAFAGMGVGNVLVPGFIKRHFPNRPAVMMSLYSFGLGLGATAASVIAAPLSATGPNGWQLSLGVWAASAMVALLPWLWLFVRERRQRTDRRRGHGGAVWAVAGSRKAVALALFFGVQSTQAYVQFGWLAQIFRDAGLAQAQAGLLASFVAFWGMPVSLAMPSLVARLPDLRPLVVSFGVLLAIGYLGMLWWPTELPWLWVTCLGLSGAAFPTALALINARSREHQVATQLSGFTQSVGYAMAALGPFAVGALFDLTRGWTVPLLLLAGSSVVMVWSGLVAATPGFVDDELPAPGPAG